MCWLNSLFQEYRMQIRSSICHIGFLSWFAPPSPSPSFQLSMVQILVIYTQTHKLHLQASMMLCLIICEFIPKIREKKMFRVRESENAIHSFIRHQPMSYGCEKKNILSNQIESSINTQKTNNWVFAIDNVISSSTTTSKNICRFLCWIFSAVLYHLCTYYLRHYILFVQSPSEWRRQKESYKWYYCWLR